MKGSGGWRTGGRGKDEQKLKTTENLTKDKRIISFKSEAKSDDAVFVAKLNLSCN